MSRADSRTSDDEKPHFTHEEHLAQGKPMGSLESAPVIDPEEERRVVRKVDLRLLPILGLLYSVSLIDRTNISVARVAGMSVTLKLNVGERYSIISLVFFVPYILFELPSNVLLRKIGARNHLTIIVLAWGAVMLGMGYVKNWTQLLVCRVLLGVLEAGFFPACLFLITCWYTRYETQRRLAAFYGFSLFLSGFSNIIGYGMSTLAGKHGILGWRWIFILYGAVTMGLGVIGFFMIVDFPDKATFLSPQDKKIVLDRINLDRGDAIPDSLNMKNLFKHLGDLKIWAFSIIFCSSTVPAYAFAYFLPVILAGGGFSTKLSLILSAPPYAFACIWVFAVAYIADKTRRRGIWIILNSVICIVGLIMMGWGGKLPVRYAGSFFAIAGCQANVPSAAAYQANNIVSHSKRAVGSALLVGWGGIGGIIASLIYRQKDYPKYVPGISATIALQVLIIAIVGGLTMHFNSKNKKADEGQPIYPGETAFRYTS